MRNEQRRRFIINKSFQYSFIMRNLIFICAAGVLVIAVIIIWNSVQFKQGFLTRLPSNETVQAWAAEHHITPASAAYWQRFIEEAELYTFFSLLWKPVAAALAILAVLVLIFSIMYSHAIAGPIHRIMEALDAHSSGTPFRQIQLRKGDHFQDLAASVNRAMMPLRSTEKKRRSSTRR
ncbi:MAG: hypothetical protein AABZ39_16740 [Spirochaetota bacterium]